MSTTKKAVHGAKNREALEVARIALECKRLGIDPHDYISATNETERIILKMCAPKTSVRPPQTIP